MSQTTDKLDPPVAEDPGAQERLDRGVANALKVSPKPPKPKKKSSEDGMSTTDGIDWSGVDVEVARHIYAQGETYLKAQHQAAIAADQRATTMASILAVTAAALVAAAVNYATKSDGDAVVAALISTAACLLIGAIAAFWAARPVAFAFPGNNPTSYYTCLTTDLPTLLGGEAENYDRLIESNDRLMGRNQWPIRIAMGLAVVAPVVGALVYRCAA